MLDKEQLRGIWRALRLLGPFLRKYQARLLLGFIFLFAVDVLQLFVPRLIKKGIDSLQSGAAGQGLLMKYGVEIAALAIGIALCRFAWRYFILGFSRLVEMDLRNLMLGNLVKLDRGYFQKKSTGDIMALATNDLAAVQLAAGMGLVAFADAFVMTFAALGCMAYIHPHLTLIAIAPMPVLAVITGLLSALLHKRFKKVQEQFGALTELARSTLSSIRLIKAYTQESFQIGRFNLLGKEYVQENISQATVQGALFPFSGFIASLSLLLVVFFGGRLTISGTISIGDFVAFMTYLQMLTWPMMALGWVTNLFQRGATSLDRINEVLVARPDLIDPPAAEFAMPEKVEFAVTDLTFAYPRAGRPSLTGCSLTFAPGLYGIIGRTGSGKSTLCQLICRLYPVPDNSILVNGRDVNLLPLDAVRSAISYVPQDITLFADTIAANIAFGRPEASREEIEKVAQAAAIHDEIIAFEHGYGTKIGEKGVNISGGQRQRLALARALLLDRPVLIIDDGLSAVDTQTEHDIIAALVPYLKDKTCIIVSHRLLPLMAADKIVVMEKGRVAAVGSHAELADNPYYRTIYQHQMNHSAADGATDMS